MVIKMNNVIIPLILTTISGLSTMLGALIIFISKKPSKKILIFSLSFASSIMLGVSITDLIPTAYSYLIKQYSIIFIVIMIVLGAIFTFLIDQYIPDNEKSKKISDNKLYKIGLFSALAICLHNIPEGIITFISSYKDITLGISLTIAIAMHNIPEGISISLPIYYSTHSKFKALLYTFISGISEPVGGLLIYLILRNYINDVVLNSILLFVGGMMSYISLIKLLPEAIKYKRYKIVFISFIIGIIVLLVNHFCFV